MTSSSSGKRRKCDGLFKQSKVNLNLNRRQFLGASAGASLAGMAFAGTEEFDDADLWFDWSSDRSRLTITILRHPLLGDGTVDRTRLVPTPWYLDLAADKFGPNAKFVLHDRSVRKRKHYDLYIRNAEFGPVKRRTILYRFIEGELRSSGRTTNTKRKRFGVAVRSNLFYANSSSTGFWHEDYARPFIKFPDEGGSRAPYPGVLRHFIDEKVELRQPVAMRLVLRTFGRLFNGLLAVSNRNGQAINAGEANAYFNWKAEWRVALRAPVGARRLYAIDPALSMKEVRFAWLDARKLGLAEVRTPTFFAEADLNDVVDDIVLKSDGAPDVVLRSLRGTGTGVSDEEANSPEDNGTTSTAPRLIYRAYAPDDGNAVSQTKRGEVSFTGPFEVSVRDKDQLLLGPLKHIEGRILARVDVTPKGRIASLSFDGDFTSNKHQKIATRIGPAIVAGPEKSRSEETPDETASEAVSTNGSTKSNGEEDGYSRNFETSYFRDPFRARWGQDINIVWNGERGIGRGPALRWIEANTQLSELMQALPDATYSRLSFSPTELKFVWEPSDLEEAPSRAFTRSSLIDLDPDNGPSGSRIDLSGARLSASRTEDLLCLGFRFSGLWLVFDGPHGPELAQPNPGCFLPRVDTSEDDPRPILAVDFPGQHLFEEALFIPRPTPLPDANLDEPLIGYDKKTGEPVNVSDLLPTGVLQETQTSLVVEPNNRAQVVEALRRLPNSDARSAMRSDIRTRKGEKDPEVFKVFAGNFGRRVGVLLTKAKLPKDQCVYIGGYALDADALAIARLIWGERRGEEAGKFLEQLFQSVETARSEIIEAINRKEPKHRQPLEIDVLNNKQSVSNGLLLEGQLEQRVPSYQLFRNTYRELMIRAVLGTNKPPLKGAGGKELLIPSTDAAHTEFFFTADAVLPDWAPGSGITSAKFKRRKDVVEKRFQDEILANDIPSAIAGQTQDGLVEGRLANPSRLAFRVRCRDWASQRRLQVTHLDQPEDADVALSRERLRFTLEDLTNFSGFELAVTRRAERVYSADTVGLRDSQSNRRLDLSPAAMLDHLGFASGNFVSSDTRMGDVQNALRSPPSDYETAIEIPARLILSPHQDAVVLARRAAPVPASVFDLDRGMSRPEEKPLWSADFMIDAVDPGLRAVHAPDLRDDFVWQRLHPAQTQPGGAAPPRGPIAPWLLGPLDTSAPHDSPRELASRYDRFPDVAELLNQHPDDKAFCNAVVMHNDQTGQRFSLPLLIEQICRDLMKKMAPQPAGPRRDFRGPTDAYTRHELVLLTSAWGLPVVGRRTPEGQLSPLSSQAEPERRHQLVDVGPGSALYRPRTLNVTELSLTSIGGSFRHDSTFEPPAAAQYLDGKPLFDALSVERWQQWTVLGRDVFCEIVYKGFLFPLGHRASLVQVTEREMLRSADGSITAYLRQRMFIRIGKPEKLFPAIAQPYGGRLFPVDRLSLLTTETPDIVDPSTPADAQVVSAYGKLNLGQNPGLAFWPRTAPLEAANIRFEMELDGATTELPLLFIDNVAANNPDSVQSIVTYYNALAHPGEVGNTVTLDPLKHLRTLRLGGVKRRYAPELEAGSSSLETDHWTLYATGRRNGPANAPSSASGDLDVMQPVLTEFSFDPVLQGADQPPFYPGVHLAQIRARQTERLIGRELGPVRAKFDAHYVREGFPEIASGEVIAGNASEVFLTYLDQPKQDMEKKGDQSGGVFRPAGLLVGMSRRKGALTSSKAHTIRPDLTYSALSSVYNHTAVTPPLPPDPSGRNSIAPVVAPAPESSQDNALKRAQEIYKNVFSSDAKILGLVSLKELMDLIEQLENPNNGMPELSEKVRHGVGQVEQAIGSAGDQFGDQIDYVRLRVIKPLADATSDIREGWNELERAIARQQNVVLQDQVDAVTIKEIFPELDTGLTSLNRALTTSAQETDQIAFALSLGEVYEAGRRFIDALKRAMANPIERIETAFRSRFDAVRRIFSDLREGLPAAVKAFVKAHVAGKLNKVRREVAELLVPAVGGDGAYRLTLIRVPELEGLEGVPELREAIEAQLVFPREDLVNLTDTLLHFMIEGGDPSEFLESRTYSNVFSRPGFIPIPGRRHDRQILSVLQDRAEKIQDLIDAYVEDQANQITDEVRAALAELSAYVAAILNDAVDEALDYLAQQFQEEIGFVIAVRDAYHALEAAIENGKPRGVFEKAIALTEIIVGPTGVSAEAICVEVDRVFVPLKLLVGLVNPKELVLCEDILITRRIVLTRRQLNGQTILDIEVADRPQTPKAQATTCGKVSKYQDDLVGVLEELPPKVAEVRKAMTEARNDVPSQFVDEYRTLTTAFTSDARDVIRDMGQVNNALAETYRDLVNDARDVEVLSKALNRIKDFDICDASLKDPLGQVTSLPRDLAAFLSRREALLRNSVARVEAIGNAVKSLASNTTVQVATFAALLAQTGLLKRIEDALSQASQEVKDRVARVRKQIDQIRADFEAREHKLARDIADTLLGVLTPTLAMADNVRNEVKKIRDALIEGPISDVVTFDGIDKNLAQINAQLGYLGELRVALAKIAKDPKAKLGDFQAAVGNGPNPLQFVGVDVQPNQATIGELRQLQVNIERELKNIEINARRFVERVEAKALTKLDEPIRTLLNKEIQIGGDAYSLAIPSQDKNTTPLYPTLLKRRDKLLDATGPLFEAQVNRAVLVPVSEEANRPEIAGVYSPAPQGQPPTQENDLLAGDVAWLQKVLHPEKGQPISDPKSRAFLKAFFSEWREGEPTPFVIAGQVGEILSQVLKGDILKAIDLNAIRDQIEDYLLDLIPAEIEMGYGYGVRLSNKIADATGGIFVPGKETRLDVDMKIVLQLDPNNPSVKHKSVGTLGPFDIKLVGDAFDALTLKFSGATFTAEGGSKPRFDIQYKDYEIGPQLEFVQQLQSIISPKEGSGAFIYPTFSPRGVEAGYSMNLGMFSIGAVSFFNIALNTSAILPFEDEDARFRASLSSRSDPFTISYLPYGGSGFFAIEANTNGIVGFEASFEFGGAAAFGFGPLTGQGRLMAGIYIRQMTLSGGRKLTEISGTFFVGGSAQIWIFSLGASLYVRLGMVNGDMSGEAVFTYSFSIGIKDFEFSITVFKKEGKGFSGGPQSSLEQGATRFADMSGAYNLPPIPAGASKRVSDAACACDSFSTYKSYFAFPTKPGEFF